MRQYIKYGGFQMDYPAHYHKALGALISHPWHPETRRLLATSLRQFRAAGEHEQAIALRNHVDYMGWPIRIRPNGRRK